MMTRDAKFQFSSCKVFCDNFMRYHNVRCFFYSCCAVAVSVLPVAAPITLMRYEVFFYRLIFYRHFTPGEVRKECVLIQFFHFSNCSCTEKQSGFQLPNRILFFTHFRGIFAYFGRHRWSLAPCCPSLISGGWRRVCFFEPQQ